MKYAPDGASNTVTADLKTVPDRAIRNNRYQNCDTAGALIWAFTILAKNVLKS